MAAVVEGTPMPPLQILLQQKHRIQAYDYASGENASAHLEGCELFSDIFDLRIPPLYSPDGSMLFAVYEKKNAEMLDTHTGHLKYNMNLGDIQKAEFSPKGTFLVTWSHPKKGSANEGAAPNLHVWNTVTATKVASYNQKVYRDELIQWTADESLCFRLVSNELHIYNGLNLGAGFIDKLHCKGLSQFKISAISQPRVFVSAFVPSTGGNPARVSVYCFENLKFQEANQEANQGATATATSNNTTSEAVAGEKVNAKRLTWVSGPTSSRAIMAASEAKMSWNASGTSLLVHSSSDVDSSSSSYYGATGLYIMFSDKDDSSKVEQAKEGPVYDAQWNATGDKFAICAGTMPCNSTLYNDRGKPIYQFGTAHRNTIRWAPHGRFLCIAGFGNLAGEMDFFDVVFMKKLGSNTAHCSVTSVWSPDSRQFMTATLAPRMNVDNGFKIFTYRGVGPIANIEVERAYFASWRPSFPEAYPNRPPSPKPKSSSAAGNLPLPPQQASSATGGAATAMKQAPPSAAAPPGPYRPPGSRGAAASFVVKDTAVVPVGKVKETKKVNAVYAPPVSRARVIPGMAPPASTPAVGGAGSSGGTSKQQTKKGSCKGPSKEKDEKQPSALSPEVVKELTSEERKVATEKKVKALRKKVSGIHELQKKQDAGADLDSDQLRKLSTLSTVEEEIRQLESAK